MKNLIKKIFFISSIFINANALSADVLDSVNAARDAMEKAKGTFNNSLSFLSASATVATGVQNDLNTLQNTYDSIQSSLFSHSRSLEQQNGEVARIKTSLEGTQKSLNVVKENFEKVTSYFPIGETRGKFGDKLCQEARALVDKNPGDNHQDRKYIENLIQSYISAKEGLRTMQESTTMKLVDLSVANPRLEGIGSTLKMALTFNDKFADSIKENDSTFDSLKSSMNKANDFCETIFSKVSENRVKANQASSRLYQQHVELVMFLQNEFFKSEKFNEVIFTASINSIRAVEILESAIRNASIESLKIATPMERRAVKQGMASADMFAEQSEAVVSAAAAPAKSATVEQPKTARAEVLAYAVKIRNLTAEFSEISMILYRMTNDSFSIINQLQNLEYQTSEFLRNSISNYSMSQQLVSTIESFKNTLKVNEAQSEIRLGQFEKFIKSFEDDLNKSMNLCDDVAKKIQEARSGL